jgi:hypothetical protein
VKQVCCFVFFRRIIDFTNSVQTQREFLILKEAQYEGEETANKGKIESEGVS